MTKATSNGKVQNDLLVACYLLSALSVLVLSCLSVLVCACLELLRCLCWLVRWLVNASTCCFDVVGLVLRCVLGSLCRLCAWLFAIVCVCCC